MSEIERILGNFDRQLKDDNFHIRGAIPPKKAQGAISAFAQGILPEDILVLVDGTVFGSAQEGVVITEKMVYAKNASSRAQSMPLEEVESVAFKPGMLGSTIILNEIMALSPPGPSRAAMQQFAAFIEALAQISKVKPVDQVATPAPITPAKSPAAPVKPQAATVASKATPSGSNTTPAVLPAIAIEVVEAKVRRNEVDESGDINIDVTLRAKQIRGKNISYLHYEASLCSAQGHVIGSETGTYEYEADDDSEDVDFNFYMFRSNVFGASLDDALTSATLYVSVIGYATQALKFAPAMLALGPVNLKPVQSEAHVAQLKVLRATAITRKYSDSDNDVMRDVSVQVMVQKMPGVPLTGAGVTMSISGVDCNVRYFHTTDRSIPHSAFVISESNGLTKSELKNALSNAIEAELYYYVPVARGLAKKVGIEIEEDAEDEYEQEDIEDSILSDFDNDHDESSGDTDSDEDADGENEGQSDDVEGDDDYGQDDGISPSRTVYLFGFISPDTNDPIDLFEGNEEIGEVLLEVKDECCTILGTGESISFDAGYFDEGDGLFPLTLNAIRKMHPDKPVIPLEDIEICCKYFWGDYEGNLPEHIEIIHDEDDENVLYYDAGERGPCFVVGHTYFDEGEDEPNSDDKYFAIVRLRD